jgi:hypothetical protein
VVWWTVLKEVGRLAGAVGMFPDMLTRHSLSVSVQLANRQASVGMVKEVLTMVVAGVETEKMDGLGMIERLIDMETMKEVAKVYMTNLKREGKMVERVHSASMLLKLVGLPVNVMQGELEWKGEMLEALASVSIVGGVVGVLNSSGRDQKKALGVIDKLEKRWGKGKGEEAGVFLFLYCQM